MFGRFASATLAFKATVEMSTPAFDGKKAKTLSVTSMDGGLSCRYLADAVQCFR